eukprot:tig00020734_g13598.t1
MRAQLHAAQPAAAKEKKPKGPKEKSKTTDANDSASKAKGGKSACAAKDPNAPKRPSTAYAFFSTDKRDSIKAENPGASFRDLGKLTPYEAKAAADKARYEREKSGEAISAKDGEAGGAKEAKASMRKGEGGEEEEKPKGGKPAPRDPGAPKRPSNSYAIFFTESREKLKQNNMSVSSTDLAKICGEKWREMTAEEKAPYEAKAAADKARYEREKSGKAISAKDGEAGGAKEAKASMRKGEGGEEEEKPKGGKPAPRDPGAPKRPSNSYAIFFTESREKLKQNNMSVSSTDLAKICGEKWREMTAEEKAPYEAKAAADKARYEREKNGKAISADRAKSGGAKDLEAGLNGQASKEKTEDREHHQDPEIREPELEQMDPIASTISRCTNSREFKRLDQNIDTTDSRSDALDYLAQARAKAPHSYSGFLDTIKRWKDGGCA